MNRITENTARMYHAYDAVDMLLDNGGKLVVAKLSELKRHYTITGEPFKPVSRRYPDVEIVTCINADDGQPECSSFMAFLNEDDEAICRDIADLLGVRWEEGCWEKTDDGKTVTYFECE